MAKNPKKNNNNDYDKNGIPKVKSNVEGKYLLKSLEPYKLSPRNEKQKKAIKAVRENNITFLIGAVGSGKTTIGCAMAYELFQSKQFKQIILLRPVTTSKTEHLGYLKGDMNDKIEPLLLPLKSTFQKIMGKEVYQLFVDMEIIVPFAINFIEGMTYENSIILLDEFQNIDDETLRSILTRITDDSKVIVMGDRNQIKLENPSLSSAHSTDRFKNKPEISVIEFEEQDIVRGKITRIVESCYKEDSDLFDLKEGEVIAYNDGYIIKGEKKIYNPHSMPEIDWIDI